MDMVNLQRRKLLVLGGAVLGAAMLPGQALASMSTARPRLLTLKNVNTGEFIKAEFFDGLDYIPEELARLNHFFRDHRRNLVKTIDPKLFDQLYRIQGLVGTTKPVQILSGYRSPATNEMLRSKSSAVAENSYHTKGQAMDIRMEGIQVANLRKAALSMKCGGVGFYPKSNFVHIDTGPVRSW